MMDLINKRTLMFCLTGTVLIGLASCDANDPNYDNAMIPEVKLPPHQVTGVLSAKDGSQVAGATVKMGDASTVTDEQGFYVFNDVQPGEYVLQAESEGRLPAKGQIAVADINKSQTVMWNAVLVKDIKEKVFVSQTEEQQVPLEMEVEMDNPEAYIPTEAIIPANAIQSAEKAAITFTPLYSQDQIETRGGSSVMLIGTKVECDVPGIKFDKPIILQYSLDDDVAENVQMRKYESGRWVPVASTRKEGLLSVQAEESAPYGVFIDLSVEAKEITEPIELARNEWDNLYGKKTMHVRNVMYEYKLGSEIIVEGGKLGAAVLEALKTKFGIGKAYNLKGRYEVDEYVEVGKKLIIEGTQEVEVKEMELNNSIIRVKKYGEVKMHHEFYAKDHGGGTN